MTKMIIKRDGRTKQFDAQRIRGAIDSAAKDYYGANYCFVDQSLINLCVRNIVSRIDILDTDSIPVETIQDIVVDELRRFDVGLSDCYSYYRDQRNIYRNSKNELVDAVSGLLDFTNQEVLTENANK